MPTMYVMERGSERMNVPDDKHQQYLDAGFVEVDRYEYSGSQPAPKPVPLAKKTVPELKEIAKELNIEGYSSMNKDALLAEIEEAEADPEQSDEADTAPTE